MSFLGLYPACLRSEDICGNSFIFVRINSKRIEDRLWFQNESGVLKEIKKDFKEIKYSENSFTLNLLFESPDFSLDKNIKIKARKYVSSADLGVFDLDENFLLDYKVDKDGVSEKNRTEGKLSEHIKNVRAIHPDLDLYPRGGFVYHRKHFVSNNYLDTRITVDSGIVFFLVDQYEFVLKDPQEKMNFEFKCEANNIDFIKYKEDLEKKFGGVLAISKREKIQELGRRKEKFH